jgi:hypothetical protein
MWIKTKIHENLKVKVGSRIHRHIYKHWSKSIRKIIRYVDHVHHTWLHVWELMLIVFLSFFTFIFASGSWLPNNIDFDYPLKKVSTLECRTLYWNEMPENCKIDLPIIHGANYSKYQDAPGYRDIYTTLWAAPYSDSRNNKIWAHAGVDIATARGTPLYSIWNWKVYFAGWNSAYGNVVKIKYLYRGEYIYVIYAHMDTIEIEQWKTVSRWQRIWTVGNSGNTFWMLWWYHVHFQVAKDAGWWPKYSYLDCPDLLRWHYRIIQEWLCREQLFANEYDPIRLLEQNHSPSVPVQDKNPPNLVIDGMIPSDSIDIVPVVDPLVGSIVDNTWDIPAIDVIVGQEIKKESVSLDISTLDQYSQHFWNQNEILIESDLLWRNLKIWEEELITITINKKNPSEKYNGILNIPFTLIPTNTNVLLNLSNIRLVDNWKVDIKVKWDKVWASSVLINFGWKRIGKLSLDVVK